MQSIFCRLLVYCTVRLEGVVSIQEGNIIPHICPLLSSPPFGTTARLKLQALTLKLWLQHTQHTQHDTNNQQQQQQRHKTTQHNTLAILSLHSCNTLPRTMSANNNNNSNSNSQSDEDRQEQETIVLWEFRNAFQHTHERLLDDTEVLTDDEHSALERLYRDPTWYCLGAGLVTLGLLRTGRYMRHSYRAAARSRYPGSSSGGGYTMDVPPTQGMPPPQPPIPTTFSWKTALVDFVLCTFAGAVTGTYMVDMDEANGGLDQMALVPGRSGIAQEFCPALLEEYHEQWNEQQHQEILRMEHSNGYHTLNGEDDDGNNNNTTNNTATIVDLGVVSVQIKADPIPPQVHKEILEHPHNLNLQAYLKFVQNCKHRHAMERRLRKDWGLSETASVAIPPPGVVVGILNDEVEDEWESSNQNSSGDDEWDQDEVSNWVSDQGDKKR